MDIGDDQRLVQVIPITRPVLPEKEFLIRFSEAAQAENERLRILAAALLAAAAAAEQANQQQEAK